MKKLPLHTLRTIAGANQATVAQRCKATAVTIGRMERGHDFTYSTMIKYLDSLGATDIRLTAHVRGEDVGIELNRPYIIEYDRVVNVLTFRNLGTTSKFKASLKVHDDYVTLTGDSVSFKSHTFDGLLASARIAPYSDEHTTAWKDACIVALNKFKSGS